MVLVPTYGFPYWLYTDNGLHFTGSETVTLFESHGTQVAQAPTSHHSLVGLVEPNVHLVMAHYFTCMEILGRDDHHHPNAHIELYQ